MNKRNQFGTIEELSRKYSQTNRFAICLYIMLYVWIGLMCVSTIDLKLNFVAFFAVMIVVNLSICIWVGEDLKAMRKQIMGWNE